ncbi:class Ib ribonucleoside-diphosphate reductase assembly flavoprotein NrdI [Rhodococcus sp. 14-2483-1-1]|uniref:Protein NrdI n=1 Tax=Rhodococcoides yunnanense TaxID=278209 RepID=A0ABU4BAK5_9NOCA|nr:MULTISPECIES: class Ib ribonucleoside-diphosphate reductase assembly flavoprotein NrdI [Rhodococcus]MDI9895319.1 class Ib ribonucleoside-diphosphate reductase assembly flavoprotein NrdI [Rhodococcus sp. IEGM 1381]MDV6261237.1 class Ib ribonucleoside-diphosphate reductase assembly flavoprotein NrdI [Rhodococcus yunnanensis]OZC43344.1 class Ib ribonucleoside-diphosphate reductase assembly flavoprotein NrdI [Rhodococcus sp. WWJCD1]OZC82267.1 class Ib ribonucleoside-diphosphate reductase assembl
MSSQPQSSHSLVYFSSASENTHRFVSKLDIPATRIPLRDPDGTFRVHSPYVLVVPTYGGGTTYAGRDTNYVPKRVIKFLNDEHNRSLIRAVIAAGNTNFGDSFCFAGDVISQKCAVPYLYRFELMGTPEDVVRVREGLEDFWEREVRRAAHTH